MLTLGFGFGCNRRGRPLAPTPLLHPTVVTNTLTYKGITFTFDPPVKIGTALNGQKFIATDTATTWTASDYPSALVAGSQAHGAQFDPQLLNGISDIQGCDEKLSLLTGSQAAGAMDYDTALNIDPGNTGIPFDIPIGLCGRLVKTTRNLAPANNWQVIDKKLFINIVPEVPPYGAVFPIFDGLGGVEWETQSTLNKNAVFAGCGYVTGQPTLASCRTLGYVPDCDMPFFFNNGEQRRPWLANTLWDNGYASDVAGTLGPLVSAMHAEGPGAVANAEFYALATIGGYFAENSRRGNIYHGGAGQSTGMKPLSTILAMATSTAEVKADCLLHEGSETHQYFWVTEAFVGVASGFPNGSGAGNEYRWTFEDVHVGRAHFFHGGQALPPNPAVDASLYSSAIPVRYEFTSGSVGLYGAANILLIPGAAQWLLQGGANDQTNPFAAWISYWRRYSTFNNHNSTIPAYGSNALRNFYLEKALVLCPVAPLTTVPDAFAPRQSQTTYLSAVNDGFHLDFTDAMQAIEAVTRLDLRYTLDEGVSFLEDLNVAYPIYDKLSGLPRGVNVGVQNRRWSASGAGPWSVNKEQDVGDPTRFVIVPTGTPSGAAVNVQAPQISQHTYPNFPGRFKIADATVPVGTVLYAGKGWWTGDITGAWTYSWKVEGVEVGTGATYTVQTGDASITLTVTNGGVSAVSSNTVNDTVLAITSPSSGNVNENSTLSHALTATRPATFAIRTVAQNGASLDDTRFEISGSTLRWVGNGTKDYEAPNDSNTNNTYVVVVRATNAYTGQTADQTITYTVTDVAEGSETYYNFTAADGTVLSAISGWTLASPYERLQVLTNFLRRIAVAASPAFYHEGVNTTGTQRAAMTFAATGTSTPHIVLFGEWISGLFNGYALYPSNATTLALRKYIAGVDSPLTTITVANSALAYEFEAHDTGSGTELKVFLAPGGAQQGSTFTDNAGDRRTGGYNGIFLAGTTSSTANVADDFRGNMQF